MNEAQMTMPQTKIAPGKKAQGVLGLGCWAYGGGFGEQDEQASLDTMATAFDAGMNHIDTARAYGRGASERIVGRFIAATQERCRDNDRRKESLPMS